jgi:hypothetical protein
MRNSFSSVELGNTEAKVDKRRDLTLAENSALDRQLATAVRYAQQGDKAKARELLEAVLKQDRANEQAWIWLASVVDSPKERRVCIERVIKINPRNTAAQAALNTMVGVLAGGEQPRIDYAAISRAAAKPLPTSGTRQVPPQSARNLGAETGNRRNLTPFLIIAAVVLVVLFGLTLVPSFLTPAEPTATATNIPEITQEPSELIIPDFTQPSPTIAPTSTLSGTVGPFTPVITLPPTFTPTVTETATNTPTSTATLPAVTNYNWLLLATQGTSLSTIYRVNGNGQGLEVFIANISEIDYDLATGLLAFVEPTTVTDEEGTSRIVNRMYIAPIGSIENRTEITSSGMPNATGPSISPDGTRLAFASDADGDFEIYVYEISSANISKMTNNEVDDIDPDWSSAGSNLVYSSDRISPTRFQLYNMASSGSDAEANAYAITDLDGSNTDAAWSPTSGLIVFRNQDGASSKLMMTDTNSSFYRELTFVPSNIYGEPSWTLDGLYVVFSGGPEGEPRPLYLVPSVGGRAIEFEIENLAIGRVIQR